MPKLRFFATIYCLACTGFMVALFTIVPPYYWAPDARLYYTAAQAALRGNLDVLYDPRRLTDFANQLLSQASISPGFTFATFLYPPIFLLVVVPLGFLPPLWFYVCFELVTASATAAAMAWRGIRRSFWQAAAVILSPAGCLNLIQGQNAFLSLGLLTGGVRLLDRRPVLAGALLGALAYKPQHALLVPFALVGARAWTSLVSAAVTMAFLALLSAVFFGGEAWSLWLNFSLRPPAYFYDWWFAYGMHNGFGLFVCAIVLGASPFIASLVQGFFSLVAAVAVLYVFRRATTWETRTAGLLCGAALANPHLQGYEMVLIASAVSFMFLRGLEKGFIPGELLLLALLWAPPVFPPVAFKFGFAIPIELVALGALIVGRAARSGDALGTVLTPAQLPATAGSRAIGARSE